MGFVAAGAEIGASTAAPTACGSLGMSLVATRGCTVDGTMGIRTCFGRTVTTTGVAVLGTTVTAVSLGGTTTSLRASAVG